MRILISNPFGIGDVLFTLPLVQAIRSQDPEAFIGYLCNRRTAELVSEWTELNWHSPFELRAAWRRSKSEGWNTFQQVVRGLSNEKFELLLDFSLGWQVGAVAWAAGIPRRLGFDYRNRGRFLTERIGLAGFHHQPIPDDYLDLLPKIGLQRPEQPGLRMPLAPKTALDTESYLRSLGLPSEQPLLGIVPGGGASWGSNAPFKQWAPDRFAQAADTLSRRHHLRPLLIGDSSEKDLIRTIARQMESKPIEIAPAPSLLLLAGVLQRCRLVLGNDSGPMHLACAVGSRTLSIFGPVDASVYGPYTAPGQEHLHPVAVRGLACRPCYQNFRFPPCPWDKACLNGLPTETVLQTAEDLLHV